MTTTRLLRLALVVCALGASAAQVSARADYAEVAAAAIAPRAAREKISTTAAAAPAAPAARAAIFAALHNPAPRFAAIIVEPVRNRLYLEHRALLL